MSLRRKVAIALAAIAAVVAGYSFFTFDPDTTPGQSPAVRPMTRARASDLLADVPVLAVGLRRAARRAPDGAVELLDMDSAGALRDFGVPTVVVMVGVNGSGKTTTIGKIATKLVEDGKKVMLVAGYSFGAAAVAHLNVWGKRAKCDGFAGKSGADPASVVFDAVTQAKEEGHEVVLVDTAGRLHTKSNLMDELKKVVKTMGKALPGAPHETLLVVDATNGQNALAQAKEFGEALELNGIVLTKLDGTAKGGVVLAIAQDQGLPFRYVGVGERPQDLRDFDAKEFVEAMLVGGDESQQAA